MTDSDSRPIVREFLYVDIQRVRSYFAQVNRGIVESIKSRDANTAKGELEAGIFGLRARGGGVKEWSNEESRSLQEITYLLFEELFDQEQLITEVDRTMLTPESWLSGEVHKSLTEGQILRYTGDLKIFDPEFASRRVHQLTKFAETMAGLTLPVADMATPAIPPKRNGGRTVSNKPRDPNVERQAAKDHFIAKTFGAPPAVFQDLADLFGAFTNETVTVQVNPCGEEYSMYHFSGALLNRSDYIQDEREELFGRYGMHLKGWTIVMQIARMPEEVAVPSLEFEGEFADENGLNRIAIENMATTFVSWLENMGVAPGARFPSIAVTPLAIYREFP